MDICCTELYQNRTKTEDKMCLTALCKECSQAANMAARTSEYRLRVSWTCIGKGSRRTAVTGFCLLNIRKQLFIYEVLMQYKPTKCTFSKLISLISCLLHISKPRVHLQQDGCTSIYRFGIACSAYKTAYTDACKTYYTVPVYTTKRTIPYLYIQPSPLRWTIGFETCRRHKKIKDIGLEKVRFICLYFIIILQCTVQKTWN
jgi:hypothetical protein